MKKPSKLCVLRRPRLRQSWNKYNIYNIVRLKNPLRDLRTDSHFRQKFAAKSHLRAYHGEHVGEKRWLRLFSRRIYSAVEMPPEYLATHDGSEQATGRGSGRDVQGTLVRGLEPGSAASYSYFAQSRARSFGKTMEQLRTNTRHIAADQDRVGETLSRPIFRMTPYMQNLFWPLERRLDTAIFRALFSCSVRQARQFVVHGAVRVNGLKVRYPGYLLNPGDMFQVEIEKVMSGTGQPKSAESIKAEELSFESVRDMVKLKLSTLPLDEAPQKLSEPSDNPDLPLSANSTSDVSATTESEEGLQKRQSRQLRTLVRSAKELLRNKDKLRLSAKDKQELRLFREQAHRVLSSLSFRGVGSSEIEQLASAISRFQVDEKGLRLADAPQAAPPAPKESKAITAKDVKKTAEELLLEDDLTPGERIQLTELLDTEKENPVDPSKSYLTPWRPRPFMQLFAFIPRYLEVNQNICAAVYLRHPLVHVGSGEVPTPFNYETSQMGHSWYIRPRKF